jgi:hypothetical protein
MAAFRADYIGKMGRQAGARQKRPGENLYQVGQISEIARNVNRDQAMRGAGMVPILVPFLSRAASLGETNFRHKAGQNRIHLPQSLHWTLRAGIFKSNSLFLKILMCDLEGLYSPWTAIEQTNSHILHPVHLSISTNKNRLTVASPFLTP